MTAWGDGTPGPYGNGAHPQAGPPPQRNDDTRVVVLVVMFTTAIVLVGIGAFLVGRGPSSGSDDADVAATLDAPMVTPTIDATTSVPSTVTTTTAAPSTVTPTPTTAAPTTGPATTTAPTSTQALASVDNSARARADLQVHFDNHSRVDLDAAYAGLSESFAPPFDEFVAFWGNDVAAVDSPIDDCTVIDSTGTCRVRFFITYSDATADANVRGTCLGQLIELTMQETDARFLIDGQRNIEPLTCP